MWEIRNFSDVFQYVGFPVLGVIFVQWLSPGKWWCVVWKKCTDISEDPLASIHRLEA